MKYSKKALLAALALPAALLSFSANAQLIPADPVHLDGVGGRGNYTLTVFGVENRTAYVQRAYNTRFESLIGFTHFYQLSQLSDSIPKATVLVAVNAISDAYRICDLYNPDAVVITHDLPTYTRAIVGASPYRVNCQ